jgi:hypothetical protein
VVAGLEWPIYHRIVIALHETIRLTREIDEVIGAHGGWPGAFRGRGQGRAYSRAMSNGLAAPRER